MMQQGENSINLSVQWPLSKNIIVLGRLGRGSNAHVFKARGATNKQLYALKVVDKTLSGYCRQELMEEIEIHSRMANRHIVRLVTHIQDLANHYIVTEYCCGGQSSKLLMNDIAEPALALIAYQIALALHYLHEVQSVAHCDLKMGNILLHGKLIKLCDFGFSTDLRGEDRRQGLYGTLIYMAPEVLRERKRRFPKQADIFAFGIVLLALLLRQQPYSGLTTEAIEKQIIESQFSRPVGCSSQLLNLLEYMLHADYSKRPTAEQILNHAFMKKYQVKQAYFDCLRNLNQEEYDASQAASKTEISTDRMIRLPDTTNPLLSQKNKQLSVRNLPYQKSKEDSELLFNSLDSEKTNSQPLQVIRARLLHPFSAFKYHTKNKGEVEINPNGDLHIKIHSRRFSILEDGKIIKSNSKEYHFEELSAGPENINCDTVSDTPLTSSSQQQFPIAMAQSVYRYASNIVQIICKKKYSRYFSNPPDFSYAMTKDRTYFLAEYSSPETIIFVHKVGSDIVKLVSGGITKNFRIDQLLHSSYSAQDSQKSFQKRQISANLAQFLKTEQNLLGEG